MITGVVSSSAKKKYVCVLIYTEAISGTTTFIDALESTGISNAFCSASVLGVVGICVITYCNWNDLNRDRHVCLSKCRTCNKRCYLRHGQKLLISDSGRICNVCVGVYLDALESAFPWIWRGPLHSLQEVRCECRAARYTNGVACGVYTKPAKNTTMNPKWNFERCTLQTFSWTISASRFPTRMRVFSQTDKHIPYQI